MTSAIPTRPIFLTDRKLLIPLVLLICLEDRIAVTDNFRLCIYSSKLAKSSVYECGVTV